MVVDVDPFPSATVGMVDARLPKNKGKGKAELIPVQHISKYNSRPRLKIDLFQMSRLKILRDQLSSRPCLTPARKWTGRWSCAVNVKQPFFWPSQMRDLSQLQHRDSRPRPQPNPHRYWELVSVRECSIGSIHKQRVTCHLRSDDVLISMRHSIMRIIMREIVAVPVYLRTRKPSNPEPHYQRWYSYNSPTGVYTTLS